MIKRILKRLLNCEGYCEYLYNKNKKDSDTLKLLVAKGILDRWRGSPPKTIQDAEFRVFSQFGEDGVIQYLLSECAIIREEESFVELGVEDYEESNTRFLLINNNWRGLIVDGSKENIQHVKKSDLSWRHDLKALQLFVTKDNIDSAISGSGFHGKIGLLSIDLDGNDYWVWEQIKSIDPVIVIIEYNSLFGSKRPVSIPYDKEFIRSKAHYSWLYWGASIAALAKLGASKGYSLVGANSAGCNLFFVKSSRLGNLKKVGPEDCFVRSRVRESRAKDGQLSFLPEKEQEDAVKECPVYDFEQERVIKLEEVFRSGNNE